MSNKLTLLDLLQMLLTPDHAGSDWKHILPDQVEVQFNTATQSNLTVLSCYVDDDGVVQFDIGEWDM